MIVRMILIMVMNDAPILAVGWKSQQTNTLRHRRGNGQSEAINGRTGRFGELAAGRLRYIALATLSLWLEDSVQRAVREDERGMTDRSNRHAANQANPS